MFCEKCGSIIIPKKVREKTRLICSKCGYRSKKKENIVLKEKIEFENKRAIEVVDRSVDTLPKTREMCPKCGHGEAYYWLVQTRAADEAETRFFKCVKCSHTWRSYN